MSKRKKIFLIVLAGFLLLDLVVLNLKIFSGYQNQPKTSSSSPTPIWRKVLGEQTVDCPSGCLDLINSSGSSQAKEIYIPLGQGSTESQEWVEIPGAEAVINKNNFLKIKSVIFEVSLRIPTGNGRVYAKLFNVTEKHDVWFSEVWAESSQSKREESKPLTLGSGRHLYRVMMKSTMGYEAILDQARLKIVLQ